MAIRHYKKISELNAVTSASLETYVAGVDNGQTVRITLDVLADGVKNRINTLDVQRLNSLESATSSYITSLNGAISSSTQISNLGFITSSIPTDISRLNSFTSSQATLNTVFTNGINARLQTSSFNSFSASVHTEILAATNEQDLNNLEASASLIQSWNKNKEYMVGKSDQLTFSGDYVLDNAYLFVEGGQSNTIGEWDIRIGSHNGSITKTSNNTYLIEGPNSTGNFSDGNLITRYFATATTLSIRYVWSSEDAGNEFPTYDITTGINNYPYEISTPNVLSNPNASSESGSWSINVPDDSYLTFGIWSGNSDNLTSTLQLTLPYLFNPDMIEYSPNKFFKKEGKIFIGGNLLLKNGEIENNGLISVGGEVILIGNSQIYGTGTII